MFSQATSCIKFHASYYLDPSCFCRVHGVTVAEMPLIATCSERRRQGMCRRLLGAIEEVNAGLKNINYFLILILFLDLTLYMFGNKYALHLKVEP